VKDEPRVGDLVQHVNLPHLQGVVIHADDHGVLVSLQTDPRPGCEVAWLHRNVKVIRRGTLEVTPDTDIITEVLADAENWNLGRLERELNE
jgi:hypothetical protein